MPQLLANRYESCMIDLVAKGGKKMSIAQNVKEKRQAIGLNQRELAEKIGVDASMITHIEAGRRNMSIWTASRLAKIFRCRIEELIN